jgi:hypothetical protein
MISDTTSPELNNVALPIKFESFPNLNRIISVAINQQSLPCIFNWEIGCGGGLTFML